MSRFRRPLLCLPLACAAALLGAASASAGVITIGSPLQGEFSWPTPATESSTYANGILSDPSALLVSPVDGTVIRWRLSEGFAEGPFALEIIKPGESGTASGGISSVPVTASLAPGTYPTDMPIKAGEGIGLNVSNPNALLGVRFSPATKRAQINQYTPQLSPTISSGPFFNPILDQELGFNADVLPAPTVTGLSPTTGPAAGGTKVTITGSNFVQVSKVSFGSVAAAGYKVESEGKITATAPARTPSKAVTVSVTTVAGSASAANKFTYAAKPQPKVKPKGSGPRPARGGGHQG